VDALVESTGALLKQFSPGPVKAISPLVSEGLFFIPDNEMETCGS
jgi:hypothetical protein